MTLTKEQKTLAGRIGNMVRNRPGDDRAIGGLRRDLRVSKAEDVLAELLIADPPPTPEQCSRLARMLFVGGAR